MPKARASRATFLPMVPRPMMPRVLPWISYMAWCRAVAAPTSTRNIGMLRDHAPRYHEHQHHGMLCYRDGVSAAVVGNRHLGAARSLEIDVVVAGAEQLVQTEAGRGTIEGVAGAHIGVADEIFGGCERGFELGVLVAHDDELEPGRCERAGKLGDLGEGGRNDNDAGKGHGEVNAELTIGAVLVVPEYYIETGKPSSAPLGAMGDRLCKGLEAANNVNMGTSIVAFLADHERAFL